MTSFDHSFHPWPDRPTGTSFTVDLSSREIEDAGLLEVLQTPGVAMGTWSILDALLDPGNSKFVFKEPLGRAREVKVAVSGLFGRFVARAYAMRYLGYTHFSHIAQPPMTLSRTPWTCVVSRVPGAAGDMPDWVAWSASKGHAIIEAKGSHDPNGPQAILQRAYKQAERATIRINGRTAAFKRYAIATRWGFATGPFYEPMIAVKDPAEPGDGISQDEQDRAALGVVRLHLSRLLRPLGHVELADAIENLVRASNPSRADAAQGRARGALAETPALAMDRTGGAGIPLIGGFVSKGGPIGRDVVMGIAEQETLARLELRPAFVGVEHKAIMSAIEGNLPGAVGGESSIADSELGDGSATRRDGSGTWIARIAEDELRILPS